LAAARRQGPQDDSINQKCSGLGCYRTKRLQGQQRDDGGGSGNGSLATAATAWQRQRQLGGNAASGAAQRQHQSKILRDRESQNHKTVGTAAQRQGRWRWRQLGGSSSNLMAAWRQGPHDNNIIQKYSGIGNYRIKRLVLEANISFKDKPG
jgi:hypothetical protein